MNTWPRLPAVPILALQAAALLAAPHADAARFDAVPQGGHGRLHIEFELKGKEDGRPIHRTVAMVLEMESDGSFDLASEEDAVAAASQEPRREQRIARARISFDKLDMDAITRVCERAPDSKECKAGQKAFADSMAQADAAMRVGMPQESNPYKDRGLGWHGLMRNGACGTIEGHLLDPGRAGGVTRLSSDAKGGAGISTCMHKIIVDRKYNRATIYLVPFEQARPGRRERGYSLIEGLDFDGVANAEFDRTMGTLELRALAFKGDRPSGSASYRGPRGVTTMRWRFERL